MKRPQKNAHQRKEIALPGLLDSERNESDKHAFFLFLFFCGCPSPVCSIQQLSPAPFINFTPHFIKKTTPTMR